MARSLSGCCRAHRVCSIGRAAADRDPVALPSSAPGKLRPASAFATIVSRSDRFLRHLRPYWDIFRHRMPKRVAETIAALQASGDLDVVAGRLRDYSHDDNGVALRITRARGGDDTLHTRHIINCTGPRTDFSVLSSPIILDARRKRLIKADEFGLGIETEACVVIDEDGVLSDWLYAIGPLTRPAWWEITAAPEINAQIARLAASFATPGAARAPAAGSAHDFGWEI